MFELTDAACKELDAFFDGKEKSSIRVFLAPGGCCGPRLGLALDAPNDNDSVFDDKGYSFCINTELLGEAKNVRIDFSEMGFSVESELQLGGGCSPSSCAGCASNSNN